MKIGIAADHRGYQLKSKIIKYLTKKGYEVEDYGTSSIDSVDYPEFGFTLGEHVSKEDVDFGIAICGSGIGISIACNKVKGVRCAKPQNTKEARLSREHNDANILALSSTMPYFKVLDFIDTFLKTEFSNIPRHQHRIDLITEYENQKNKVTRQNKEEGKQDER